MTMVDPRVVLQTIQSVIGTSTPVALHEPRFAGREWEYTKECLDTGWISSVGKFVDRFEAELARTCQAGHAIAVVNGTAALQIALVVAGVSPGEEVLMPALTFVATANAVAHCSAIPHFVDSEELTLGIDVTKLRRYLGEIAKLKADGCFNRATGRRIAAIVPVHIFGHPVDMDALSALAAEFRVPIVEDATEALGSEYKGRRVGSLSPLATLSFNGNKIVTTGGGGAILAGDQDLARRIKHLTTTAKKPHRWSYDHDAVAYNYRLPNINAAVGLAQLEQLDGFVAAKRRLAARYTDAFAGMNGIRFLTEPPFARSNYWLNTLLLESPDAALRDEILALTNDASVMTRPAWRSMHELPMYRECPCMDLSIAESLEARIINIPSSAVLGHAA